MSLRELFNEKIRAITLLGAGAVSASNYLLNVSNLLSTISTALGVVLVAVTIYHELEKGLRQRAERKKVEAETRKIETGDESPAEQEDE